LVTPINGETRGVRFARKGEARKRGTADRSFECLTAKKGKEKQRLLLILKRHARKNGLLSKNGKWGLQKLISEETDAPREKKRA